MASSEGLITVLKPIWLNVLVPEEYEDEGLYEIILFFVIHSPCPGQSAHGILLSERGWKAKPWYSPKYLKERLDKSIFGEGQRMLKMVDSKPKMISETTSLDFDEGFYNHRDKQRALFVKVNNKGCSNEYMSLFYHIRNALAHGRIAMYPAKNDDITFVMEDGKKVGADSDNAFEVSARIVINKSSLLKIIKTLNNPPKEKDYSDDILNVIKSGFNTKAKIIKELEIDESTYNTFIQSLRINQKIEYDKKVWKIIEQ